MEAASDALKYRIACSRLRSHPRKEHWRGDAVSVFCNCLNNRLSGGIVAEPFLATADQRLVLGHTRIIDVVLPTQGEGDGVSLGVDSIAFEKVIGSLRDSCTSTARAIIVRLTRSEAHN